MVVCLVSPHTRDDTTIRWPRNGTVGPEIAIFTTIWGIGPNSYKNSPRFLRLERHRLLFDELVLGQDQLLRGCYFFGPLRRRSQGEKFRGELSPRPRDTAGRHSCVSWLSQPVQL